MSKQRVAGLGPLQSAAMEFLWTNGPATVADIVAHLSKPRRAVTYTTVLVALQKLEKKGWVDHEQRGRAYLYRARVSRDDNRSQSLGDMLQGLFSGDVRGLVSQLLYIHPVTDDELRELRQLIDQRRKELKDV